MTAFGFSSVQVDALISLESVLREDKWALIGASAIRCQLPLPRPTFDIDLAVSAASTSIEPRLVSAGWQQDSRTPQRWTREGAFVDLVIATLDDIREGIVSPTEGFELTVVGFDLAYQQIVFVPVTSELRVPVARIAAITLLKMIAWQDRPFERDKDLSDIFHIWKEVLPDVDDRRFEPPLSSAGLEHDDQGAFHVGWDLGKVADLAHQHWIERFLRVMSNDEGEFFARFIRASQLGGDNAAELLRNRLAAFEAGLKIGLAERTAAPPRAKARIRNIAGSSLSLQGQLHDAIDQRRLIRFHANGQRMAEPHVLGLKNGGLQLLAWQTGGDSSSGPLPGWRRFKVSDISILEILPDTFGGARVTSGRRHSAFDRHIAVVR